ncbi:MAG: cation diffusion facilitator family transporter [Marinifilaceae bacterium]|jgi:cobalt-zinc-cadmium efflux system protein|nr:cation diffusion facilitator family transporter [Marinifilaceae bacterium]
MAHNHAHGHVHSHEGTKNITIAFILNAIFVVIEIVGGLLTNSIAILSDALHDFGDCISLGITWGLQKKSQKGRDANYSYGYKRFSLLGSIFLGGILSISSVIVMVEAVGRILNPEAVDARGMLWLAIIGVFINGLAAFRLSKGNSISQRAVYLHIMEDVLGWIAVLVSSVVMMYWKLPILDSILSIAISTWVLYNVYKNLRRTFAVLLQAIPKDVNVSLLEKEIKGIEGVVDIHDVHIWSLDGESHVMSLHLVLDDISQIQKVDIKKKVKALSLKFNIVHITNEIEFVGEECINSCD